VSGLLTLDGKNCLVLGAGGFIGSHLCHVLAGEGARVHGFGRPPKFPDALPAIRWTTGEFSDRAALALAVDGAEVVFHLLGGTNPEVSNNDPIADLQVNTIASVQLLELCRAAGVGKVVFVSSGGTVYGAPQAVPILETAPTDPISAYGINKLMVEKYLQLYEHLHGFQTIVLRVANAFGPYQSPYRRQGVVPALIETYLAGRPVELWGDGHTIRDFVFVRDLAEAIVCAARFDGPHQVVNIGSGIGRSLLEVVGAIGIVLGLPPARIIHKPARRGDVRSNVLDIARARDVLGWAPRTEWMAGLQITAEWIRATYGFA
jgi:UDP-glucose 4-epimerase